MTSHADAQDMRLKVEQARSFIDEILPVPEVTADSTERMIINMLRGYFLMAEIQKLTAPNPFAPTPRLCDECLPLPELPKCSKCGKEVPPAVASFAGPQRLHPEG